MKGIGDYISRKTAYQFFKDQLEEETGAFRKGRNAGLRVAMSAVMNNDAIPAADVRPEWIMIESRPMDAEERQYYSEQYGYELADDEAVIYCSQLPEDGQEVLVCNKWGHIWIDTFDDDPDYGVGFETNGDMDGLVAWMPLPQPPKEE